MSFSYRGPVTGINATIGSTPLVRLINLLPQRPDVSVYAKLEGFNPTHSAKDRTAHALVEDALQTGMIPGSHTSHDSHASTPDNPSTPTPSSPSSHRPSLVESSSGNLGMALARECATRGWDFHCVVDPRANEQTIATMKALGSTVHMVTKPDEATGDWLIARRTRVKELLDKIPGSINLGQYSNKAALTAHDTGSMAEIMDALGTAPDFMFVAMSTTGTIGGCALHLKRIQAPTHLVGVDAEGSVLFGGRRATRTLPGFGAGMVPELAQYTQPDEVARLTDVDSVIGTRILARREGILAGASGGAVVSALLQKEKDLPHRSVVVLLLHDDGQAYMNTVYDPEWVYETLGLTEEQIEEKVEAVRIRTNDREQSCG
ncbi:pyridoxal-phosphate dependent enzyme [Corynebacterium anserum]|uniref:Pyridoxal-phosphate dependent enzyme n=1 Tax=Corynebacterium anserum TaxID=2684406 RepID=A0A7G7YMU2_9CORY|nr:pyridoxal-phosphate dependent enzyme [Corynebacterium anserum]MBC2681190.1 pyridoxal-phosphate dependent enzyme [Corynebacterium anserum]QNH95812.1 pyridoxal-phosphate dependent enzyme [Corynebacterium anserum]